MRIRTDTVRLSSGAVISSLKDHSHCYALRSNTHDTVGAVRYALTRCAWLALDILSERYYGQTAKAMLRIRVSTGEEVLARAWPNSVAIADSCRLGCIPRTFDGSVRKHLVDQGVPITWFDVIDGLPCTPPHYASAPGVQAGPDQMKYGDMHRWAKRAKDYSFALRGLPTFWNQMAVECALLDHLGTDYDECNVVYAPSGPMQGPRALMLLGKLRRDAMSPIRHARVIAIDFCDEMLKSGMADMGQEALGLGLESFADRIEAVVGDLSSDGGAARWLDRMPDDRRRVVNCGAIPYFSAHRSGHPQPLNLRVLANLLDLLRVGDTLVLWAETEPIRSDLIKALSDHLGVEPVYTGSLELTEASIPGNLKGLVGYFCASSPGVFIGRCIHRYSDTSARVARIGAYALKPVGESTLGRRAVSYLTSRLGHNPAVRKAAGPARRLYNKIREG